MRATTLEQLTTNDVPRFKEQIEAVKNAAMKIGQAMYSSSIDVRYRNTGSGSADQSQQQQSSESEQQNQSSSEQTNNTDEQKKN